MERKFAEGQMYAEFIKAAVAMCMDEGRLRLFRVLDQVFLFGVQNRGCK